MKKLISILLTLAMLATMMAPVFATGLPTIGDPGIPPKANDLAGKILGLVQWIGYAFAIGMLLYIGIKYMMSAADAKADLKAGLIKYVIGAGILFAASTIVGTIDEWID